MLSAQFNKTIFVCFGALAAFSLSLSCGTEQKKSGSGGAPLGQVELALTTSVQTDRVPKNILLAAAYVESRLEAGVAGVTYFGEKKFSVGTRLSETAFGLSRATLKSAVKSDQAAAGVGGTAAGTESASAEPALETLPEQIAAYGAYLRGQLDKNKLELSPSPASSDEIFEWIWFASRLHRESQPQKEVAVLFAQELIDVLNTGFIWQSPSDGEVIELTPLAPKIEVAQLSLAHRQIMRLDPPLALLSDSSMSIPLVTANTNERPNRPTRLLIVHCPFELSACLEMQNYRKAGDLRLESHYVIPRQFSDEGVFRPIEVTDPRRAVTMLDQAGKPMIVNNAIVIMLVGQSGRLVDSIRTNADPRWITDAQLIALSRIMRSACRHINDLGLGEFGRCLDFNDESRGPQFMVQAAEESYRWGEIPDFDREIFLEYVKAQSGPFSAVNFVANAQGVREAGDVQFQLEFPIETKHIFVEKLIRCRNGRTVWQPVFNTEVHSVRNRGFVHGVFDGGPNGNGTHFFRAKIYSQEGLIGWTIDSTMVRGFDREQDYVNFETCRQ